MCICVCAHVYVYVQVHVSTQNKSVRKEPEVVPFLNYPSSKNKKDVLFLGSRETVKFAQLRSWDLRPGGGAVGRKGRKGGTWGLPASRSPSCLEPFCLLPSSSCDCSVPTVGSTCSQHRGEKGVKSYLSHSISPMSWF